MIEDLLDLKDNLTSLEFCINKETSKEKIKSSMVMAKLDILEEKLILMAERFKRGVELLEESKQKDRAKKVKINITNILNCIYKISQIENKIKNRECKVTSHVAKFIQNV